MSQPPLPHPTHAITHGDWTAIVAPTLGGSILSLRWRDRPILRETDPGDLAQRGVRAAASFPLVPYANRIDSGRFRHAGQAWAVPCSAVDPRHALHGTGWMRPWPIETDAAAGRIAMALRHDPDDAWPFAFIARQRLILDEAGAYLWMQAQNLAPQVAPMGLGHHPFFACTTECILTFAAEVAWQNDARALPFAPWPGDAWRHETGRLIGSLDLDHDFGGWNGRADIRHADGLTVHISTEPVLGWLRVYAPPVSVDPLGRRTLAVEPVSHAANAINRSDAPSGIDPSSFGLAMLEPGESLTISLRIAVSEPSS
jgi:aldose 1-epimerase